MRDGSTGRRSHRRFAIALAVGMLAAGCVSSRQYDDGADRAEREIALGVPCFYSISMADLKKNEPHTGLPYLVLEAPITPELLKMMEGHNTVMLAHFHKSAGQHAGSEEAAN